MLGDRHVWPAGFHEPLTTLAWLAARTERIGLAVAGLILPLYSPVLLAEALANVDVLSGGRLTLGTVLGYRPEEFAALGVEPRRRVALYEECLRALTRLWVDGRDGDVCIAPRPAQRPRPRIWGAGRVEAAIARTARLCDGWTSSFNEEPEELAAKIDAYLRAPASAKSLGREVIVCREAFCAPTTAGARAIYERPAIELFRDYAGWKRTSADAERYQDLRWDALAGRLVVGDPDEVVAGLDRYRAMGADGAILRVQPPELDHADAMRCLELLGRDVLPRLR